VVDVAFRGGGIKGAAFVGAMEVLLKQDPAPRIRRLIGTSAGAIFATCFAAGYAPAEMLKQLEPVDDPDRPGAKRSPFATFAADPVAGANKVRPLPEKFGEQAALTGSLLDAFADKDYGELAAIILKYVPIQDILTPVLGAALSHGPDRLQLESKQILSLTSKLVGLLQFGAACDDRNFRRWLDRVLLAKIPDPAMTLEAFHETVSRKRGQQLSLMVTDVTAQQLLVLNHHTAPRVPLREAVRMSMGIPLVWPEVEWKREWGSYRNEPRSGNRIVDGGVLSNFPLRFLLNKRADTGADDVLGPPPALPGVAEGDVRRVGLFFDDNLPADAPAADATWYEKLPAYQSTVRVLDTMTDAWDRDALRVLPEAERKRVVCEIGTKGYSALEFDMSAERLAGLVQRGRDAMTAFLKQ
jgi:predicted acylesterase/phospholipase RssA